MQTKTALGDHCSRTRMATIKDTVKMRGRECNSQYIAAEKA